MAIFLAECFDGGFANRLKQRRFHPYRSSFWEQMMALSRSQMARSITESPTALSRKSSPRQTKDSGSRKISSICCWAKMGQSAAKHIDAWLRNTKLESKVDKEAFKFEELNTWYCTDAPHAVRERLEATRRINDFSEIVQGLDGSTALYEACRCMSCGNCFECDNCFGVCPDNAIKKLGPRLVFEINLDYCKGCGICVSECPASVIGMVSDLLSLAVRHTSPMNTAITLALQNYAVFRGRTTRRDF